MSTKKQPLAADLPNTTAAPAKPRTRKPALKAVPAGTEEAALAKISKAAPVEPNPFRNFDELTLRQERAKNAGLRLEIIDLEGKLRDANTEHERAIAALVKDLDDADDARALAEDLAKVAKDRERLAETRAEGAVSNALDAANKTGEVLGKLANDRWHAGRAQAEIIRRKRFTFWERVCQVFRPDDFNGSNVTQALCRIRLDMVDEAEADALRGIQSSEGDLGELAHKRIKARGAV